MKTKVIGTIVLAAMIYSCASKPVVQSAPKEEVKIVALSKELTEGKNLYENNCAKCHKLFEPSSHNKEDWKTILVRMQRKAKIDDAQTASIYDYVTSEL